jgi:hypothetical protein
VKQLDGRRHVNAARTGIAAQLRREQQQRGPHALAAGAEHVIAQQAYQLARAVYLLAHGRFDLRQRLLQGLDGAPESRGGTEIELRRQIAGGGRLHRSQRSRRPRCCQRGASSKT